MDDRIKKALEISNYLSTINNQKRIIKEQFIINTLYYFNGGQFTVNQTLISFVKTLLDHGQVDAILIDDHTTPISIENLESFLTDILDVYFRASNKYLTDFNELKSKRTVEGLIND